VCVCVWMCWTVGYCVTVCVRVCSNAFVGDCVEHFFKRRVLGVGRDQLRPVCKQPFRYSNNYQREPAARASFDGDNDTSGYRPERRANWRSGPPRCSRPAADELQSPRAQGRRARFYTEPVDQLDVDHVLSFLDQMNFQPSKNKLCTASPDGRSSSGVVSGGSCDAPAGCASQLAATIAGSHDVSSLGSFADDEAAARSSFDNVAVVSSMDETSPMPPAMSPDAPVNNDESTSEPSHIPDSVIAFDLLSSEDAAPPEDGPPEPDELSDYGVVGGHQRQQVLELSSSEPPAADDSVYVNRRNLSSNASSYFLEQEDGDVILESASSDDEEEDFE